jgi:hypothetical protein
MLRGDWGQVMVMESIALDALELDAGGLDDSQVQQRLMTIQLPSLGGRAGGPAGRRDEGLR